MTQMLEKHLECLSHESIIKFCVQKLHEDGMDYQLLWLQTVLLETCFIKYGQYLLISAFLPPPPTQSNHSIKLVNPEIALLDNPSLC